MMQPDTGARERGEREEGLLAAEPGQTDDQPGAGGDSISAGPHESGQQPALPPGQYVPRTLPVLHYGPIPVFNPATWDLRILGATESGEQTRLRWDDVAALPVSQVTADFHCVTKFTVPGIHWTGVLAGEILRRYPPDPGVTHVMVWAEFGYSANIRIGDFAAEDTLLATHRDDAPLTTEHG